MLLWFPQTRGPGREGAGGVMPSLFITRDLWPLFLRKNASRVTFSPVI